MRSLRPWLAGAVTLVLLGALGSTTVAQGQQGTATHVRGVSPGGQTMAEGTQDGVTYRVRGAIYEHAIEWSDSRLPTLMRIAENVDVHLTSDGLGAAISVAGTVRLEDARGSWTGVEYGLLEQLDTGDAATRLVVLEGAGAYAGLSAILTKTYEDADYGKPIFDGYIFDGEMTPMPDALAAFDETADVVPEAVAEPAPSPAPAPVNELTFVTGSEDCGERVPPMQMAADGSWEAQDSVATCQNVMSDPRVSGAWTNTMNARCFGKDLCLLWGTAILEGPAGGWECSWSGSNYPVGTKQFGYWPILVSAVCPGTGDYEGLTYVFQHASIDFAGGSSFNGVIYEGPPPPVMAAPAE